MTQGVAADDIVAHQAEETVGRRRHRGAVPKGFLRRKSKVDHVELDRFLSELKGPQ